MDVLDYLRTYEYATPSHVAFELAWHTGMRIGALRGLDTDHFEEDDAYLEVLHQPGNGTPLKNNEEGERLVGLSNELCRLISDYIENQRPDVQDEEGREPLLATSNGRASYTTIRRWIYKMTRPCMVGKDCPEGRDPDGCEAATHTRAFECPFNVSPHAVRRGTITYHLLQDWPEGDVSGRMDVSPDVIEDHYDQRTNRERLEQRRDNLRKL